MLTPESKRQVNRQQSTESSGENEIPSPIKRTEKVIATYDYPYLSLIVIFPVMYL